MRPLRKQAQPTANDFQAILRQASTNEWKPKCKGNPGPYMDYGEPPTFDEAEELCAGCPLLSMCFEYALATKQPIGVWGGFVFEDGKPMVSHSNLAAKIA